MNGGTTLTRVPRVGVGRGGRLRKELMPPYPATPPTLSSDHPRTLPSTLLPFSPFPPLAGERGPGGEGAVVGRQPGARPNLPFSRSHPQAQTDGGLRPQLLAAELLLVVAQAHPGAGAQALGQRDPGAGGELVRG